MANSRIAAQRKLAKEIKSGTYKPSSIGAKARELTRSYDTVVKQIQEYKSRKYGGNARYDETRSIANIVKSAVNGEIRTIQQLREILKVIQAQERENPDNYWPWADEFDEDYLSIFWYH